jgi:hypothetical protein
MGVTNLGLESAAKLAAGLDVLKLDLSRSESCILFMFRLSEGQASGQAPEGGCLPDFAPEIHIGGLEIVHIHSHVQPAFACYIGLLWAEHLRTWGDVLASYK